MCQLPFKEGVGTYLQLLCSYSIDQNLITWPLLAARESGLVSALTQHMVPLTSSVLTRACILA